MRIVTEASNIGINRQDPCSVMSISHKTGSEALYVIANCNRESEITNWVYKISPKSVNEIPKFQFSTLVIKGDS